MKKTISYIFFSLLILLFLNGCGSNSGGNNNTSEDIFQYKGSVIGDNSAVTNIIGQLQHNEEFQEVSLETKAKPYGMTLKYENIEATMIEKEYKETTIYNATFLFALIDNAEWTIFNFGDHTYKITKSKLQDWYGKELNEFTNEEGLKTFVQEQLKDESKVNQLFTK
ncbi:MULTISPECIES: DUF4825 domain-containing protein [Virgibacillus]|uniref:DUF4825 domain-containing protein n=1 Tax=Virgibacillus TaxID=84406 RepID=UPI0003883780|nr:MULTISPECIES: DUF4825 domain-containing protein [Virgibacillus]EQB36299.1 hypothetical protein M948_14790 [Virgibacillus sp. CM-4]